jgi:hypothetical protein
VSLPDASSRGEQSLPARFPFLARYSGSAGSPERPIRPLPAPAAVDARAVSLNPGGVRVLLSYV